VKEEGLRVVEGVSRGDSSRGGGGKRGGSMCWYGVAQGPLNYKKDLRLKLNWEEIEVVFKSLGYTFLSTSQVPLPPASTTMHPSATLILPHVVQLEKKRSQTHMLR
jgi:hypothetical protein